MHLIWKKTGICFDEKYLAAKNELDILKSLIFTESVIVPIFAVLFSLAYWILAIICYNNLLD